MLSLVFALITKTFKRDAQPLQMNSYFCNCVSCCLPSAVLPYILLPHFFFIAVFEEGEKKSVTCGSMITIGSCSYFSSVCLVVHSQCKYAEAGHVVLQSGDLRGHLSETLYVISNFEILVF